MSTATGSSRIPDRFGRTVGRATLVLVALGLAWRAVRYALAFPLWGDEAFLAVNFFSRDLAGLAEPLEFRQVAPPGFLWGEWLVVRTIGGSERALRLLPFLSGVGSLLLFWRFCRQTLTRRAGLLAVALMAASFFPVRYAAEVKPYAFDLFVSLLVTSLAWSVWNAPESRRRWLALTAASALGVWFSYTAVFPVAGVGLVLLFRAWRAGEYRTWALAFGLVSGTSWLAMMVGFARPQLGETPWLLTIWHEGFPPLSQPWRLPWWLVETHTGGLVAYPYGGRTLTGLPTALLAGAGAFALWRSPRRRWLALLLLSPLPLAVLAAALRRYPYGTSTRLMLYMAPAVCMLAGQGMAVVLQKFGTLRRGPVAVAGLLALIPVVCTVCDVCMPYRKRDDLEYRRFVANLASKTAPGDRWVVFDGADPLPHYPAVMASVWVQRVAKLRYYVLSLSPVPARFESDPRSLASSSLSDGRTWLILHDHGFAALYPQAVRARFEPTARAALGPPASSRHTLPVGSTVDVHVFDPGLASRPAEDRAVR
ncbi:MAG: glycosyltransferase family 39 protein [Isosphaeraceae bacterium]